MGHGPDALRSRESEFHFHCHPGLACFTKCCRDVNIFLSPYDILRMKKRLGISSEAFLAQFTRTLISQASGFPLVVLKMRDDDDKTCPFVLPEGCSVYEERPWSCRMYPLDRTENEEAFCLIGSPSLCLGMQEERGWKIADYLRDQGIEAYAEMEAPLRRLASHPSISRERILNPKVQEMCRMALYDLDRFRRFVLESRFLDIFYVEKALAHRIRSDDLELMKLAYRWLEFGLADGGALRIREDILKGQKARGGNS